jgi:hypothetical protein
MVIDPLGTVLAQDGEKDSMKTREATQMTMIILFISHSFP